MSKKLHCNRIPN